ncbi:Uncharacterised protein [uncultured archaeon]|nr:Uncharacterised protein [uncultured archaeon]
MSKVLSTSALILLLCYGVHSVFCSPDWEALPGVYDLASNDQLAISVMDMHRHDDGRGSWISLGLVVENVQNRTISVDPTSFKVIDSLGGTDLASTEYPLMNPLVHRDVGPGGEIVGSLGFKLEAGAKPVMLVAQGTGLKIRLDKADKPPGISHSPGVPVAVGDSIVGIEGISRSEDGRMVRIDYLLKNSGPGVMLLEPMDYGRFGVLIDTSGWSYPASDYKMLGPAVPPGVALEGFLTYLIPDGSDPRYLLFWPPDEDAVLFDLDEGEK